ncbi:P1 family peptidase [uncultured Pontibacter sp.]|uniref:DmpA family aminopeptidase n=1 Tax=uncultured Pontibacter sp. TaxID=453356 RepID=UPI00261CDB47|nr:P1 family peptidase [uncultured Pontibacter sp.]
MKILFTGLLMMAVILNAGAQDRKRARDLGIRIGVLQNGMHNAITDVAGLRVGHTTLVQGEEVRTGVTAIVPHGGNLFQRKVPAAVYVGNGFGKLAGSTQVQELGNLESPIILTNTLGVGTAMNAVVGYTLQLPGNETVQSVNALVGETNDGYLNDIRGRHVQEEHVLQAIKEAADGPVAEGNVGAGTGTVCFGYKGGIGTASRKLPASLGGYTVGVLVQSNFGGVLQINGAPVGEELGRFSFSKQVLESADGSCMIVVATDAPVDARNLERIAKRAMMGLAKTGGIASNGSGDYVIAFSTNEGLRIPYQSDEKTQTFTLLRNDEMSPLFMATIEATEEAIINSLFKAETMKGRQGHTIEALPVQPVIQILKKHNAIKR